MHAALTAHAAKPHHRGKSRSGLCSFSVGPSRCPYYVVLALARAPKHIWCTKRWEGFLALCSGYARDTAGVDPRSPTVEYRKIASGRTVCDRHLTLFVPLDDRSGTIRRHGDNLELECDYLINNLLRTPSAITPTCATASLPLRKSNLIFRFCFQTQTPLRKFRHVRSRLNQIGNTGPSVATAHPCAMSQMCEIAGKGTAQVRDMRKLQTLQ